MTRVSDVPAPALAGQAAIRLREALLRGDVAAALAEVPALDEAHRVEVLLGAALRDARDGHRAAELFLAADAGGYDWAPLLALLADGGADASLDDVAAAWVASGRVPDTWRPDGAPVPEGADLSGPEPDVAVAALYAAGVGGLALVDAFAGRPLHAAVAHYYRRGRIHALGPRPMLVLAMA